MRRESYAFLCLIAVGCAGPGADRLPSPKSSLIKAREATRSGTLAERAAAHRRVIQLCLDEGWSDEAASDYLSLRQLAGEDDRLLESLAWGALRSAIRAPDPARRLRASQALARLIPNPRATALLSTALDDPHPEVQAACAVALCRAGWNAILTTLSECDARSEPAARRATLLAAAREVRAGLVEDTALPRALPAIRSALERGPDRVRLAALELLGELGPSTRANALLAQGIAQADEAVSQRAAVLLAARDPAQAVERWRATHLSRSPELEAFDRALSVHGGGPLAAVERDLAGERRVQLAAIRGLWGPGAARLAPSLHALAHSPSKGTRLAALQLCRRWAPLPAPQLRTLWTHADPATRVAAFTAAAERERPGLSILQPLWESGDRALAPAVAAHLLTEGQRGLELLSEGISRPATSRTALRALRGRPEARARFHSLLESDHAETRRLGAEGLVSTASRENVLRLVAGLTSLNADADVLCAAALVSAIQSPATPSVE